MSRRFEVGDQGEVCRGVEYRVTQGAKRRDDYVLEIRTTGGQWAKVSMALGCLESDFYYENEDVNYPPAQGFLGGEKYMQRVRTAATEGWRIARDMTNDEVDRKRGRSTATRTATRPVVETPTRCHACGQRLLFWRRASAQSWVCRVCDPLVLKSGDDEVLLRERKRC